MRLRPLLAVLLGAWAFGCTVEPRPESPTAAVEPGSTTALDLRVAPHIDLYYLVRHRAALPAGSPVEPDLAGAVTAARRVQEFFGSWGGWGPVDSLFLDAAKLADVRDPATSLDDPLRLRNGREIALREPLLALVAALESLEPVFLERHWPARSEALEQAVANLSRDFLPAHRRALAFMLASLAIADPGIEAPVFLVSETNEPGAFTFYLRGGRPACVVSIEGGVDGLLFETILHEATHVLDMASDDDASVFVSLRSMLEQRGVAAQDRILHDVPHTLMFVQAAETVRRFYDPQHVDYGEATTLYARSEPIASIEREVWQAHLRGTLGREPALERIVDRTLAASSAPAE